MEKKPFDNHLGVGGWFTGGRYSMERYLYTLQRLSGVGLIVFLLMHLVETSSRLSGAEAWDATMAAVGTPVFHFLEWVVMAGFIFHALNGVRLILLELGIATGRPVRPVFPYVNSLRRQRPWVAAIMAVAVIFLGLSLMDFFVW